MEALAELCMLRAENELVAAKALFEISSDPKLQRERFMLEKSFTFYSSVISHSYYCIFYSASAMLAQEGIKESGPEIHRKTFEAFKKHLVDTGKLDVKLLNIYRSMMLRAEDLLGIYFTEKRKRGEFTYRKLPQANREPAKQSFDNSSLFFKNINKVLRD